MTTRAKVTSIKEKQDKFQVSLLALQKQVSKAVAFAKARTEASDEYKKLKIAIIEAITNDSKLGKALLDAFAEGTDEHKLVKRIIAKIATPPAVRGITIKFDMAKVAMMSDEQLIEAKIELEKDLALVNEMLTARHASVPKKANSRK